MLAEIVLIYLLVLRHYTLSGVVCDFESRSCSWTFESPTLKHGRDAANNFRIAVGIRDSKPTHFAYFNASRTRESPAMIVSPYYQHLSIQCELRFAYRLFGEPGASIVVTTQHRPSLDSDKPEFYDYDYDNDWTRPTLHSTFNVQHSYIDSWKEVNVHIGHVSHPTRIRIECHSPGTKGFGLGRMNTECYIDNIQLVKCDEEVWYEHICHSNKTRKYLCNRFGHRKCINHDQLCDMTVDCPGGEDEDPLLQNCTVVPVGARCTFEEALDDDSTVACPGWNFETYYVHSGKRVDGHLLMRLNSSMATKFAPPKHVPLRDHTFEHSNSSGHFLFFTSEKELEANVFTNTKSTYFFSPTFPPTNPVLFDPTASEFGTCKIRFYYCSYGSAISTLQLIVQPLNGQPAEVLWTPPSVTAYGDQSYYCEWMKVSVDLPEQRSEYYLKMSVSKIFDSSISFAIDDFSMTPNCFTGEKAWRNQYIPYVYNITSCGGSGSQMPTSEACERVYNGSQTRSSLSPKSNGFQRWLAPKSTEYRIEAYGAAGGQLPALSINNYGGRVVTAVNLTTAMELEILVGQQGENPCDPLSSLQLKHMSTQQHEAYKIACDLETSEWNDHTAVANAVLFPGTAGGGATVIKYLNKVLLVAGGGGGVFPEKVIQMEKPGVSPRGGYSYEDYTPPANDDADPSSDILWMSGYGASLSLQKTPEYGSCERCKVMSGQLTNVSSSGGQCPLHSVWKTLGGFGGGGASCGPGGGGGAGYYGGKGGRKYHGSGGSSYSSQKIAIVDAGINEGSGYVLIFPCRLKCLSEAICRFRMENADDIVPYCSCTNGRIVNEGEQCSIKSPAVYVREESSVELFYIVAIGVFVILTAVLLVLFGGVCAHYQRRLKKAKLEKDELGREVGMSALTSVAPMSILGNPIYESFGLCADLRQIPRHAVTLIRPLGQGAFGEVYEGTLQCSSRTVRVAVKTLPKTATKESANDFEMEALIMSKFQHENICEFKGVCFDGAPRLIVLELLAGGDLKSFLRECRQKSTNEYGLQMLDLLMMAKDVATACKFLADNRFIHRDIAARNCLLTTKEKGRIVKIADFGMARDIYRQDYYRKGGKAMLPVKWMPPEAFLDGIFTVKTDVWSYGILLWEIFSMGYMPYPGRNNQEVMSLIVNGGRLEPPNGVPDAIYSLMLACWSTVHTDRPQFDEIVDRLNDLINDENIRDAPLPTILHRLSQYVMRSNTTDNPFLSAADPMRQSTHSQSTMNTVMSSYSELGLQNCDPLPTKGDGVSFNICTPYQSQSAEPFCAIEDVHPSDPLSQLSKNPSNHNFFPTKIRSKEGPTNTETSDMDKLIGTKDSSPVANVVLDKNPGSRKPIVELDSTALPVHQEYVNATDEDNGESVDVLSQRFIPNQRPQTFCSGKSIFGRSLTTSARSVDSSTSPLLADYPYQSQIL